jgi:hypothetical protein
MRGEVPVWALAAFGPASIDLMGEPIQGSDQHNRRLDEDLAHHPVVEDEVPDAELWDEPQHDSIVTDAETDQDRTDLRSEIATYIPSRSYPVTGADLVGAAEAANAPDRVLDRLRALDSDGRLADATELWDALGLGPGRRS